MENKQDENTEKEEQNDSVASYSKASSDKEKPSVPEYSRQILFEDIGFDLVGRTEIVNFIGDREVGKRTERYYNVDLSLDCPAKEFLDNLSREEAELILKIASEGKSSILDVIEIDAEWTDWYEVEVQASNQVSLSSKLSSAVRVKPYDTVRVQGYNLDSYKAEMFTFDKELKSDTRKTTIPRNIRKEFEIRMHDKLFVRYKVIQNQ